ncbi:asparagine synthase-related protein [Haloarcula amylovorans]|uniref:asparagine synthase-related protein n=1 Tax=Haloarcula amylovorans TaxID=2562280 RepID=UPI001431F143|nr:asparagine synthase-related protein [Halomicroarcula amylolytica]
MRLMTTLYPAYPFEQYQLEDVTIYVEGVVYNRDAQTLRDELEQRATQQEKSLTDSKWLRSLDGEFVFYVYDAAASKLVIVPDLLGQLPLFYATNTEYALVGRNKPILARLSGCESFDQMAVAQYLRLGYALTDRTLYADIRRLPEGHHLQINMETGDLAMHQHYEFELGGEPNASNISKVNARELASRFTDACRRRAERCPGANVVLLSGGLDSRAILGGFEHCDADYRSATRNFEHDSQADIDLAGELAAAVESNWQLLSTPGPTGTELIDHLNMTAGTDPFSIAHMQPFLRRVQEMIEGPLWSYTGDGGDKLIPDLSPVVELESPAALVDYILDSEAKFSANDVEQMTGVSEAAIRTEIRETIRDYPESSLAKKFVHFELFQRAFAWLFEATDTNRNYFWTTSPFYAIDFVEYAMDCPDEQKRRYRLYSEFLQSLDAELASVPNANFGAPPTSRSHELRVGLYNALQRHPGVFETVKPTIKRILGLSSTSDPDPTILTCLRQQNARNSQHVVEPQGIEQTVLASPESYSRGELCHVLTLLSLIDSHRDEPVLHEYSTTEFA